MCTEITFDNGDNKNSRTNLFPQIQLTLQDFHQHNRQNLTQLQFE